MELFDNVPNHGAGLRREAQRWLLHLKSGMATTTDAQAFEQWCAQSRAHVEAFAQTRRLWENLGPAAHALAAHKSGQIVTAATGVSAEPRMQPRRMTRRAFLGSAVAASAALLLVRPPLQLWPSLSDLSADYRTGTGEQRQVELSPGLIVEMNTQTTMNLRKAGGHAVGLDLTSGEIQVKTSGTVQSPFTVYAGGGSVQVSGQAQCNIRCTGSQVQVTGLDGVTTLEYGGKRASLTAAQRVDYGRGELDALSRADTEVTMAWRRRVLIFDGQPLSDVVAEINRYRPGKLILANDSLAARKVQARFSLNQLGDVAALIHDAYGASVIDLPGGIVILS
jgi:transmembrane sensor